MFLLSNLDGTLNKVGARTAQGRNDLRRSSKPVPLKCKQNGGKKIWENRNHYFIFFIKRYKESKQYEQ